MRTLYLCYFGLREPLVQTQVLPYLRRLAAGGVGVFLLTFEPDRRRAWPPADVAHWTRRLERDGIHWSSLPYHKRPSLPATVYDMLVGAAVATRLVVRHRIDLLHARAHVAAMIGGMTKALTGRKLLFDVRGFNPEEYVDAGVWPADGLRFRLAKRAERWLLRVSDGFVVLTERARDVLFPGCVGADCHGRPIEVIPCCVDHDRFSPAADASREAARAALGVSSRRVLVYVGALGGFYLTDELLAFLAAAHRQDSSTYSMILTQSQPQPVVDALDRLGIPRESALVTRVTPDEVPRYLRAADAAVSFIKPSYSKQASSPTKVAEYLASGLPVVSNAGVGDLDDIIVADRVGVIVRALGPADFEQALRDVDALRRDPETATRCVASARERFDLDTVGAVRYRRLYDRLGRGAPPIGRAASAL